MNTEKKLIYSSDELRERRQLFDFLDDSLIAYRKKIKSKVEKPSMSSFSSNHNKNQRMSSRYGYKPVNDFSKIPELTKSSFKHDPDLLIREYFITKPSDRKHLRKCTAKNVNSVEAILEILEWSTKNYIQEGYDGAVDILAECNDVVLKVASQRLIDRIPNRSNISAQEEKWEVLIKGIACSQVISAQRRFNVITKLILERNNSRSVKAAIIDALLIMQSEVDVNSIKSHLASFLTSNELDEYIQKSAKEAMEEIL